MAWLRASPIATLTAGWILATACNEADIPLAIEPPTYTEPKPISAGTYNPAPSSDTAEETLLDLGFTPASGNEVSGIRLFDDIEHYYGFIDACGDDDYSEFVDTDRLQFTYMPPGTYASGPQHAAVCPDGAVAGFGQEFTTNGPAAFSVWFWAGKHGLWHADTGDEVFSGQVGGNATAVVVDRAGRSWIGISTPHGVIGLDAREMPVKDAVAIAGGIRCGDC